MSNIGINSRKGMTAREAVIYRRGIYPLSVWQSEDGGWLPAKGSGKGSVIGLAEQLRSATERGDKAGKKTIEKAFQEQGFIIEHLADGILWYQAKQSVAAQLKHRAR